VTDSLFGKLLKLPEETFVYPAHDYNGMTVSTIGEEKRHNPRLQVSGKQAYIDQMNALELDNPRLMDIAVPANRACGVIVAAQARGPGPWHQQQEQEQDSSRQINQRSKVR